MLLIFQPYADDLAACVAQRQPLSILEVAAGTGIVTRALAQALPPVTTVVAADLSQLMLGQAAAIGTVRAVTWQPANTVLLLFPNGSFNVIACQFSVTFFPDRAKAYAEARRVLKPGVQFISNVWDQFQQNALARQLILL